MGREYYRGRGAGLVLVVPAVVLLSGCGAGEQKAGPQDSAAGPAKAAATPSPSKSPTPTPTGKPMDLDAKNGRDLGSCADARCEVEIRSGDTIRFNDSGVRRTGLIEIKVKKVSTKETEFDINALAGSATLTTPYKVVPNVSNVNGLGLTLAGVDGKRVVIRLGKTDPCGFTSNIGAGGGTGSFSSSDGC